MMKKILFLFVGLLLIQFNSFSQKLTIFSDDGYKFWLIVNGERINDQPLYKIVRDTAGSL